MEDKKAAIILISLLDKYSFNKVGKTAIKNAVGILSWISLSQGKINQ